MPGPPPAALILEDVLLMPEGEAVPGALLLRYNHKTIATFTNGSFRSKESTSRRSYIGRRPWTRSCWIFWSWRNLPLSLLHPNKVQKADPHIVIGTQRPVV